MRKFTQIEKFYLPRQRFCFLIDANLFFSATNLIDFDLRYCGLFFFFFFLAAILKNFLYFSTFNLILQLRYLKKNLQF